MFKNYFILNRLIVEFNKDIKGYKITKAFSYEKEKLVLVLSKGSDEKILEISVNPGFPFINLRKNFSIPKRNLVDFFVQDLPLNNINFEIADNDRIIRINSDKAILYFTIRGKYTNVFLIKDNLETESFKKTDKEIESDFLQEMREHTFISDFNKLVIEDEFIEPEILRKKYPVIGKDIINEVLIREEYPEKISAWSVKNILNEIRERNPALFIDEGTGDVIIGVDSFRIFPSTVKEIHKTLIEAFNKFLIEKYSRENVSAKKKIISKYLERELTKVSGKLNNVKALMQRGTREEELSRKANLLLVNINKLAKGRDRIEIQDIYNNNASITIKLDPKLSPRQNIDLYFDKARNEKIKLKKSEELFSDLNKRFSELKKINEKFMNAESPEDLNSIMKDLRTKPESIKKPEDSIKSKFRNYLIQDKYNVYVGKDSKSNDLLTMKFAKQNDYWFHARGVPGSHVVLKNENPKEGIPKNILKSAASIAAFHSKAKTSGMAPVSYTQKKYVVKKKGMGPGKVALLKEEVLIVTPELPEGVEYQSES